MSPLFCGLARDHPLLSLSPSPRCHELPQLANGVSPCANGGDFSMDSPKDGTVAVDPVDRDQWQLDHARLRAIAPYRDCCRPDGQLIRQRPADRTFASLRSFLFGTGT